MVTGSGVIPETHADILEKKGFAHCATIGPDGAPQSSPVWYTWDGEHLLLSQTTGRQKFRNMTNEPRIAVSITDPENPYRYLEIRGTVVSMDDDPGDALINGLAKKYLDEDVYPWPQPGDHRVVVKLRPEHTSTQG